MANSAEQPAAEPDLTAASPTPLLTEQFGLPPDTDWARDAAVYQIEVRLGLPRSVQRHSCLQGVACCPCKPGKGPALCTHPRSLCTLLHRACRPSFRPLQQVLPGDVLVLATDGLLDNLYPEDIVALAPRSAADVEQVRGGHRGCWHLGSRAKDGTGDGGWAGLQLLGVRGGMGNCTQLDLGVTRQPDFAGGSCDGRSRFPQRVRPHV